MLVHADHAVSIYLKALLCLASSRASCVASESSSYFCTEYLTACYVTSVGLCLCAYYMCRMILGGYGCAEETGGVRAYHTVWVRGE